MKILILHAGNPYYLKYIIAQAQTFHPHDQIVLLGDETNQDYWGVEHYPMSQWSEARDRMARIYVHLFPEPDREKVLIWFTRWFMLSAYCEAIKLEEPFWIIDSDVLLFRNLGEVQPGPDIDLSITHVMDPCFSYFRHRKVLADFCDYIEDQYTRHLDRLEAFYAQGNPVYDMNLLQWFTETRPERTVNLAQIGADGSSFCWNVRVGDGIWEERPVSGLRFRWRDGKPEARREGRWVRCNALHFIGGIKPLIPAFYRGEQVFSDRWRYVVRWWRLRVLDVLYSLIRRKSR